MARDSDKNSSNYSGWGLNEIGSLLDGASVICCHAWVDPDSYTTTGQFDNGILWVIINGTSSGIIFNVDARSAGSKVQFAAKSNISEGIEVVLGSSNIGTGSWTATGGRADIGNDLIAVFVDGVKETENAVSFVDTTYTDGTPTGASLDAVGSYQLPPLNTAVQWDGGIAEIVFFTKDIGDNAFIGLGHGVNPFIFDPIVYNPLYGNDSPEPDLTVVNNDVTLTGTVAKRPHAPVELLENYL